MGKLLEGGSRTCRQSFRRSYSFCCSSAGEQCGRSWAVVDYVIEQDMDRGYFLSWEWPGASTIELAELRQPRSEGGWNEMTFFRNNGKWLVIALIALLLYRFLLIHTLHIHSPLAALLWFLRRRRTPWWPAWSNGTPPCQLWNPNLLRLLHNRKVYWFKFLKESCLWQRIIIRWDNCIWTSFVQLLLIEFWLKSRLT